MFETLVVCASAMFLGADATPAKKPESKAAAPAQPAPTDQPAPTEKKPVAKTTATETKTPAATDKAAGKAKGETGPIVHTAARPIIEQPKLDLTDVEKGIIDQTNQERARFGLAALEVDAGLLKTARAHAAWMTNNQQLVHTRMAVAENIAMGQRDCQEVLRSWMNSSGHRANILNGSHRKIGVAAYRTPNGTIYWCQQFAW